jgi:hypothetical protein
VDQAIFRAAGLVLVEHAAEVFRVSEDDGAFPFQPRLRCGPVVFDLGFAIEVEAGQTLGKVLQDGGDHLRAAERPSAVNSRRQHGLVGALAFLFLPPVPPAMVHLFAGPELARF